ncbi:hypothetical protein ACFSTH_08550 [Paenibacillus yanchengensis]|uniref:Carboxypeptidase regulatory-like domain-containing protein n=1 Tax=Paenibacillus yanchengensis TaxID=2035833 RepID=A0ABW4YKT5_9BACL
MLSTYVLFDGIKCYSNYYSSMDMNLRKLAISLSLCMMAFSAVIPVSEQEIATEAIENTFVDSASLKSLQEDSEVSMDIVDENGQLVPNADVTVLSISEDHKLIYQGKADENGNATFKVSLSNESKASQVSVVATGVYEIYYVNPTNNEMETMNFSVQFLKENVKVSQKDFEELKGQRKIKLKGKFNNDKSKQPKNYVDATNVSALTQLANYPGTGPNCVSGGGNGYTICTNASTDSNQEVKIGTVNVGSDEKVTITNSTSSTVKLSSGIKTSTSAGFSNSGDVSVANTSGTYTINGKCIYNNGTYCNVSADFYGYFTYNYTSKSVWYMGVKQYDEYKVTPVKYDGPSARLDYNTTSNNGYTVTAAKLAPGYFEVSSVASAEKLNTSEKTYAASVSFPTPAGSFTGNTSTTYANTTKYLWAPLTPTSTVIYGHYLVNGFYHVTRVN